MHAYDFWAYFWAGIAWSAYLVALVILLGQRRKH